ncbi:Fruiting body protein SC14 [Leucoagaricus sp. SymC.cos]|nr:Fruiting body protein SC14 [Leucoagaricus sp. SymC.cos]
MISFRILFISFLTLLATLLHTADALAAPASNVDQGLSDRGPHSLTDPTAIRRSAAQISAFLQAHNTVRAKHHARPLTWSVSLAQMADQWADACNFKHTNGILSDTPYGENIVAATGDFPVSAAVDTFIQDAGQYSIFKPVYNHFTQVIWRSTTQLGCAASNCPNVFPGQGPATLYVCFYNPAGNVVGELGYVFFLAKCMALLLTSIITDKTFTFNAVNRRCLDH